MNKRKASKSLSMVFNDDIGQTELISFTDEPIFQVEKKVSKKFSENENKQSECSEIDSIFYSVIPDENTCKRRDSICKIFSSMIFSDQSQDIEPETKTQTENEKSIIQEERNL